MAQVLMSSMTEVNPAFIPYILNEANALARLDDYEIDNYMDRELLNPEMKELLEGLDLPEEVAVIGGMIESIPLTLSLNESRTMLLFSGFKAKFRRLKRAIKRELCRLLAALEEDGTIDWPTIITAVLTAIAAAFFSGPVGAIVLPILVALIAKIIRRGIDAVCAV